MIPKRVRHGIYTYTYYWYNREKYMEVAFTAHLLCQVLPVICARFNAGWLCTGQVKTQSHA